MESGEVLLGSDIVSHHLSIIRISSRMIFSHILVELDSVERPSICMRVKAEVACRAEQERF